MTIDETVGTIEVRDNGKLDVNKFIPYANNKKYFAVVGKDLYHPVGEQRPGSSQGQYRLLARDYMNLETEQ